MAVPSIAVSSDVVLAASGIFCCIWYISLAAAGISAVDGITAVSGTLISAAMSVAD